MWHLTVHQPSHIALSCVSLLPASALSAKACWTLCPHQATDPGSPAAVQHIPPSACTCSFSLHVQLGTRLHSRLICTQTLLCRAPLQRQSMAFAGITPCAAAVQGAPPARPGAPARRAPGCSACAPAPCCMRRPSRSRPEVLRCWGLHHLQSHLAQALLGY